MNEWERIQRMFESIVYEYWVTNLMELVDDSLERAFNRIYFVVDIPMTCYEDCTRGFTQVTEICMS